MNVAEKNELFRVTGSKVFSRSYKEAVFMSWFQAGKPDAPGLLEITSPVMGTTVKPTLKDLREWIIGDFIPRADKLDQQMTRALTEQVVGERISMLKRHSELARKMQQTAINYLDSNPEDLNANSAVRLLVEGVRIERESAGIPEAISKMTQMTDEQLLKEIEGMIKQAPGKVEANDE